VTGLPIHIHQTDFFVITLDCYLVPKVKVSTPTGSHNITMNHTDVTLDSPGLVNFTVSMLKVDPYFLCKRLRLYFFWTLGDGRNASGEDVEHYYNKTGVYYVVLKIFKVSGDTKHFVTNVTMKIDVKGD
jgi:hypothetical protein